MILKHAALEQSLRNNLSPLYCLTGLDSYLLNDASIKIKQAWRKKGDCDEKTFHIQQASDWATCFHEANNYSLFAPWVLLDIRYDKKSFDAATKTLIQNYLEKFNSRCLVIIQASLIPIKQLQVIANSKNAIVVQATPLSASSLKTFIKSELQRRNIRHEPLVPEIIHQYNQNNMLACAQVIEKLDLINNKDEICTTKMVMDHLTDECDYPLYELTEACLAGLGEKVIHLLRQVSQNKGEPTLILWLLTQEIRTLIQLSQKINKGETLSSACTQLNIWSQRVSLYANTIKRLSLSKLYQHLQQCHELDKLIKSNKNNIIWYELERLALNLTMRI